MRNLKLVLAYEGTRYSGWQVQPDRETIQGVLEEQLARMLGERVRLAGAGRTDAGVHARGQVASFVTASRIPPEGLRRGLNDRLPRDIRAIEASEAAPSFHARADARAKEYRYHMTPAPVLSPFDAAFTTQIRGPLDLDAMRRAARRFLGRHDFTSFCSTGCRVVRRERIVSISEVQARNDRIEYRVRADGFLQHMVRTLVGTLILVGRGRMAPEDVDAVLRARDRRAAGPCAPPQGLVLERVFYEEPR
ncbi:MAG: tRNA pseudouridine(38-40) synthase TruA [Acidobacteriota bacterium]